MSFKNELYEEKKFNWSTEYLFLLFIMIFGKGGHIFIFFNELLLFMSQQIYFFCISGLWIDGWMDIRTQEATVKKNDNKTNTFIMKDVNLLLGVRMV